MLQSLRIRNLALVEDLTWEVGPALVCVTGETGAGKSMIVGALKLVLGERADRSLIRTGEEICTVEAVFRVEDAAEINKHLEAAGLDRCDGGELIVKRVITAAGQNRQFVNNGVATQATLKEVGRHLVDLHGPHDHQSLLSQDCQRAMLDAFAAAEKVLSDYRRWYVAWRDACDEWQALLTAERASEAEIDLLRHQTSEIEGARLAVGEDDALLRRYKLATNGSRLGELTSAALCRLVEDDDSALGQLRQVQRSLREIERLDPAFGAPLEGVGNALVELEDLERTLREYGDRIELDPAALAALEERVNLIESLKRKYGGSIEAALERLASAKTRLARIEDRGGILAELEARMIEARSAVDVAAAELRKTRTKAAPKLAREISKHLLDLGFEQAHFGVTVKALAEPGPHGTDEVDFLFAPNPGEPAKPLRQIASSGEMSRLMLAAKSALARQDAIPLLVFDEIDANVGGSIATAVGRKMSALARTHQVVAITHMPQVAALAGSHYEVTKGIAGNRTTSRLRLLEGDDRVAEIARMLGGNADSARAHARSLLTH
jgi:DNA repair protein RecN (Recombination protein N)